MNQKVLQQAISLAQKVKNIFVVASARSGLPHMAAAGKLTYSADNRVEVAAWFCPGTLANLEENRRVSLVVWDPLRDLGYQLLGEAEKVEELAMMDGYAPGEGNLPPLPQVERQLTVRVDKITDFRHAPHSDRED
jgi:hypothetical protein